MKTAKIIPIDKHYRHNDLAELYKVLQHDLKYLCLQDVADKANCSASTLRNWRDLKTKSPRIQTVMAVAPVLGYIIAWRKV